MMYVCSIYGHLCFQEGAVVVVIVCMVVGFTTTCMISAYHH
jgi:hypothetical protein